MVVCVVTVRDVQPEIRPEVTEKVWEPFENRPLLRLPTWRAADYLDAPDWSGQAKISKQKIAKETKILFCPN
jgi:hypothetical protein